VGILAAKARFVIFGLLFAYSWIMRMKQQHSNKPLPRLRHIEPGQFFTLRHDPEVRVLLHKTRTHGHFNNGYASLCHELEYSCVVWGENGWEARE
jgi:hypothetical protein